MDHIERSGNVWKWNITGVSIILTIVVIFDRIFSLNTVHLDKPVMLDAWPQSPLFSDGISVTGCRRARAISQSGIGWRNAVRSVQKPRSSFCVAR